MSGPDASWIWSLAADWRRQFETFEGICLCKRFGFRQSELRRYNHDGSDRSPVAFPGAEAM